MGLKQLINEYTCSMSITACVVLTFIYVASLYVWRSSHHRDHPSVIKKRFFSVSCMMTIAPMFIQYFLTDQTLTKRSLYDQMGLRTSGLLPALTLPLFLTIILFLGPLTMQFCSGLLKIYAEPEYWIASWQDLIWIRNHLMAPLSEEWVFRACMIPLLLQCLDPVTAIFTGPLLFGIAHCHHMLEQMKSGYPFTTALFISTFQFTYTSLFGMYSSYLFLRTGHFVAPLVAHIFCNLMGFPNFAEIREHRLIHQVVIICNFLIGFIFWCLLLGPVTHPSIYSNDMFWTN